MKEGPRVRRSQITQSMNRPKEGKTDRKTRSTLPERIIANPKKGPLLSIGRQRVSTFDGHRMRPGEPGKMPQNRPQPRTTQPEILRSPRKRLSVPFRSRWSGCMEPAQRCSGAPLDRPNRPGPRVRPTPRSQPAKADPYLIVQQTTLRCSLIYWLRLRQELPERPSPVHRR